MHFDQKRLALVESHVAGRPDRLATPGRRPSLLVKRMARLMQHAHEPADELALVVAACDANIVSCAAAEWMQAYVKAATVEIESNRGHQLLAETSLDVDLENSFQCHERRQALLAVLSLFNQAG